MIQLSEGFKTTAECGTDPTLHSAHVSPIACNAARHGELTIAKEASIDLCDRTIPKIHRMEQPLREHMLACACGRSLRYVRAT